MEGGLAGLIGDLAQPLAVSVIEIKVDSVQTHTPSLEDFLVQETAHTGKCVLGL